MLTRIGALGAVGQAVVGVAGHKPHDGLNAGDLLLLTVIFPGGRLAGEGHRPRSDEISGLIVLVYLVVRVLRIRAGHSDRILVTVIVADIGQRLDGHIIAPGSLGRSRRDRVGAYGIPIAVLDHVGQVNILIVFAVHGNSIGHDVADVVLDVEAGPIVGLRLGVRILRVRQLHRHGNAGVGHGDRGIAVLVRHAGSGVGGLGAAVVLARNGELHDELLAVGVPVFVKAAPVVGEVKAGDGHNAVLDLGLNLIRGGGFRVEGSALLVVRHLQRDALRAIGGSREVAGHRIHHLGGAVKGGGVGLNGAGDGGENAVQLRGIGCREVEIAVFNAGPRTLQVRYILVIGGDIVHVTVRGNGLMLGFRAVIAEAFRDAPGRVRLVKDADGIDLGFVVLLCRVGVLDRPVGHAIVDVVRVGGCGIPIGEQDDHPLALFTCVRRILRKDLVRHVDAEFGIGIAIRVKPVNGCGQARIDTAAGHIGGNQRVPIVRRICLAIIHNALRGQKLRVVVVVVYVPHALGAGKANHRDPVIDAVCRRLFRHGSKEGVGRFLQRFQPGDRRRRIIFVIERLRRRGQTARGHNGSRSIPGIRIVGPKQMAQGILRHRYLHIASVIVPIPEIFVRSIVIIVPIVLVSCDLHILGRRFGLERVCHGAGLVQDQHDVQGHRGGGGRHRTGGIGFQPDGILAVLSRRDGLFQMQVIFLIFHCHGRNFAIGFRREYGCRQQGQEHDAGQKSRKQSFSHKHSSICLKYLYKACLAAGLILSAVTRKRAPYFKACSSLPAESAHSGPDGNHRTFPRKRGNRISANRCGSRWQLSRRGPAGTATRPCDGCPPSPSQG